MLNNNQTRYYVVADVHGFYDELVKALTEKGFFEDKEPHKLIICGDMFDRGQGALKLQEFILELLKKQEVILIRGNHEDLAVDMLNEWEDCSYMFGYNYSNGTVDTFFQLTGLCKEELLINPDKFYLQAKNTPYIKQIIPKTKNYFETKHYIFVHGWIPTFDNRYLMDIKSEFDKEWRTASEDAWLDARWTNGMQAAHDGLIEKNKTIVCGHWHCSYGHEFYGNGEKDNFEPYYNKGIIAIDACTALTRKINCIVIEDTPL